MSARRRLLAAGAATCVLVALAVWLWPGAPAPSSQPAGLAPARSSSAAPAPAAPTTAAPAGDDAQQPAAAPTQPEASAELAAPEAPEHAPPPTGDLLHYAAKPMSAVPHRVVRGWGASGGRDNPGLVGAYVIVEPGISDDQLTKLCRDIREYHRDAAAVSVRILDSEEAATYDTHDDGGARKKQHQVATVTRDPKLGVDAIKVRGVGVEP